VVFIFHEEYNQKQRDKKLKIISDATKYSGLNVSMHRTVIKNNAVKKYEEALP